MAARSWPKADLEPGELAIAPLDAAPACPWVRQRRYERIVLRRTLSATISSSWGKSSILIRELSLGGGMGTKEDNLRVGSEANIDINVGVRAGSAHVLLRRARVNEVGFEIVNTDLESRYRLRRILMDSLNVAPENRGRNGAATEKSSCGFAVKKKGLCVGRGFSSLATHAPYFTFKKMIASVYKASDSISANPRISAN